MEHRKHHFNKWKCRKNRKQKTCHPCHYPQNHLKLRRRKSFHFKHLKKEFKPNLLKLHKRGYNIFGYESGSESAFKQFLSDRHRMLDNLQGCYQEKKVCNIRLMEFLLLFLFYRSVYVGHQWNTDILHQAAKMFMLVPLLQILTCNCFIYEWMSLNTRVNISLDAMPAVGRPSVKAMRIGMSCRQQSLSGHTVGQPTIADDAMRRLMLFWTLYWLLYWVWRKNNRNRCNMAIKHLVGHKITTNRNQKKKLQYLMRLYDKKDTVRGFIFTHHFIPCIPCAMVYPSGYSVRGYWDLLESHSGEADLLKSETFRFNTFNAQSSRSLCGIRLARSGFYYMGNAENPTLTRCYSCNIEYSSWDYLSDVDEVHGRLSPDCQHLASLDPGLNLLLVTAGHRPSSTRSTSQNTEAAALTDANSHLMGTQNNLLVRVSTGQEGNLGNSLQASGAGRTLEEATNRLEIVQQQGLRQRPEASSVPATLTISGAALASMATSIPQTTCTFTSHQAMVS